MIFTVRIKSNKDFNKIYSKGAFVTCGICTVYFRRNGQKMNRIGISTGKKIGNAVKRSRARRVIRQAYRECETLFPAGFDMIVAARNGSTDCKTGNVSAFFKGKVIPAMRDPEFGKRGKTRAGRNPKTPGIGQRKPLKGQK